MIGSVRLVNSRMEGKTMTKKYIEWGAAINKIMENIVHQDSHDVNLHNIGLRKAMSAIDSLPVTNVVEVRHG